LETHDKMLPEMISRHCRHARGWHTLYIKALMRKAASLQVLVLLPHYHFTVLSLSLSRHDWLFLKVNFNLCRDKKTRREVCKWFRETREEEGDTSHLTPGVIRLSLQNRLSFSSLSKEEKAKKVEQMLPFLCRICRTDVLSPRLLQLPKSWLLAVTHKEHLLWTFYIFSVLRRSQLESSRRQSRITTNETGHKDPFKTWVSL
jgi:hypothetical protein